MIKATFDEKENQENVELPKRKEKYFLWWMFRKPSNDINDNDEYKSTTSTTYYFCYYCNL